MSMKCPTCGKTGTPVFKCDNCGDVRCRHSMKGGCEATDGPTKGQGGAEGRPCYVCKKGKYRKIS